VATQCHESPEERIQLRQKNPQKSQARKLHEKRDSAIERGVRGSRQREWGKEVT
jgi:hypothetical protein